LTRGLDWERAAEGGDLAELKRLARGGHDINGNDRFGQTALMRAAHAGRLDIVEWLIAHHADLDHRAKFNLTALMLAVIGGHEKVARRLVRAGADTSIAGSGPPGFAGKTAADLATERGDQRLATFIGRHQR
jgi:ankyrin repeat protein